MGFNPKKSFWNRSVWAAVWVRGNAFRQDRLVIFFYFILFFIGLKYLFLTTMSQNFCPGDNEHKLFGGDGFSLSDQSYTHLSPHTCRIFRLIDLCGYPVTQHNATLYLAYTTYAWQNEYIFCSCHLDRNYL